MTTPSPVPLPIKDEKQYGKRLYVSMSGIPSGMPPLNGFNPDPWLRSTRNTPGMTNRINEDRFPDNPFPGSHESTRSETNAADYVSPQPIPVKTKDWMKVGMIALGALGLFVVFSFSRR